MMRTVYYHIVLQDMTYTVCDTVCIWIDGCALKLPIKQSNYNQIGFTNSKFWKVKIYVIYGIFKKEVLKKDSVN